MLFRSIDIEKVLVREKLSITGSEFTIGHVKQHDNTENLLVVDLKNADLTQAMREVNMNFDEVYGGVQFERLWANKANINVNHDNFYLEKLVITDKGIFSNNGMVTTVYGSAPIRDGNDSIYWFNAAAHDPKNNLDNWYSYGYNGDWMHLYFGRSEERRVGKEC